MCDYTNYPTFHIFVGKCYLCANDSPESVIVGDVQVKATGFPMVQRKLVFVSKWREDIDNV